MKDLAPSPFFLLRSIYRWGLAGLGLILAGTAGWQMMHQPLWGYWPLAMWLGAWIATVGLVAPRLFRQPMDRRHFGWSTLSGLFLWLGFPDMPFLPLIFLAFVPLIAIEEELQNKATHGGLRLVLYTGNAFLLWNILSTFWVANTAFVAGIFANVVNAGLMVIPWVMYRWVRKRGGDQLRWPALIAFWVIFEWNHLNWELTWPFLSLGNAPAVFPQVVQWYEWTGAFGGTLWILIGNVLVYQAWQKWTATARRNRLGVALAWILLPAVVSLGIYYGQDHTGGEEVEVVVVQPNYEPHYEKFDVPQEQQLARFLALSRSALTPETRYLVFPETSFGNFDLNRLEENRIIRELLVMLDSFPQCALVTGLDPYRFLDPGEESPAQRIYRTPQGDTLLWEAYNLAAQFSADQEPQIYLKGKLVPGAECTPYRSLFFFLEPLVRKLGGSLAGLRRSVERGVFVHQGQGLGPVICYESVFGEYTTGYIRRGAGVLAIITNDGWWDVTPGHRQHLQLGALRAIETRRDIIRSANTGISGLIDPSGILHQATAYGEEAVIRGTVTLRKGETFYVRWGDYLARLWGFVGLIVLIYTMIAPMRRRLSAS